MKVKIIYFFKKYIYGNHFSLKIFYRTKNITRFKRNKYLNTKILLYKFDYLIIRVKIHHCFEIKEKKY